MTLTAPIENGDTLRRQGRLSEAEAAFRAAMARAPGDGTAVYGLGVTLKDAGRATEALEVFTRAAALAPRPVEAFIEAGVLSAQLGRSGDAERWIRQAAEVHPSRYEPYFFLGCILANQNRFADAIENLCRSLSIHSPNLEATKPLIYSLRSARRFDEAQAAALDWSEQFPDDPEAAATLAQIARERNLLDEALIYARRAHALAPGFVDWTLLVSRVLVELGLTDEAIEELTRARQSEPNNPAVLIHLGNVLKVAGDFRDARDVLRRASELSPHDPSVFYELADITKFSAGDPLISTMEKLASDLNSSPARIPTLLHFALGKMNDDLGRTERAFAHFKAGNDQQRLQNQYDEKPNLAAFERIQQVFSAETVNRLRGGGATSDLPIFLVGMPRSGSTLLEQVLVSHPSVVGAGEVPYLPQVLSEVLGLGSKFDDYLDELTKDKLGDIARRYIARLQALARPGSRVTDKLLANSLLVGVIHLALPNAKIIHCVRDPVDTCLSCFMKSFGNRMPFTNDLSTLGRYYRAQAALMAHWRDVLPPDAFLDVRYEDVVGDVESQARRLIAYCGLDWDNRCIAFYETRRPVNTASMAQVREPIYSASVGRWRRYEKQLAPLLDALGGLAS